MKIVVQKYYKTAYSSHIECLTLEFLLNCFRISYKTIEPTTDCNYSKLPVLITEKNKFIGINEILTYLVAIKTLPEIKHEFSTIDNYINNSLKLAMNTHFNLGLKYIRYILCENEWSNHLEYNSGQKRDFIKIYNNHNGKSLLKNLKVSIEMMDILLSDGRKYLMNKLVPTLVDALLFAYLTNLLIDTIDHSIKMTILEKQNIMKYYNSIKLNMDNKSVVLPDEKHDIGLLERVSKKFTLFKIGKKRTLNNITMHSFCENTVTTKPKLNHLEKNQSFDCDLIKLDDISSKQLFKT